MTKTISLIIGLLSSVVASIANSATMIDTTSSWDGVMKQSSFGEGSTVSYGQSFLVTNTDNNLASFSFWIDDSLNPDPISFSAYVMEWQDSTGIATPAKAVGNILYQSSSQTTTNNGGSGGMEVFTFDTGGVTLEAGKKYVAFMSAVEHIDGTNSSGSVGAVGVGSSSDIYPSGDFVYQNTTSVSSFTSAGWNVATAASVDLAFTATLTAVPIPSVIWLFGSGLIGIIGILRR